ncbi:hypothetical protein COT77_02915 [Candidatus Berkelbacteria bacterium CG10_big_fil_rev_8_21_14_0_10_41_12]|uniref:Lipoprotein n=2 Tax=Bacteria candidate phyla TaxID=1783234 RepID=A0A2M6WWM0_9BACT|nr:MAG: hypothetical protein COT77_02915 [Candidatus Berkelbacteria bacterium CG10_big_fil_rev_8_21_14_0_10_41_12]
MKKTLIFAIITASAIIFSGCTPKATTSTSDQTGQTSATATASPGEQTVFDPTQNILALEDTFSKNYSSAIESIQSITKSEPTFCNVIIENVPGKQLSFSPQTFIFSVANMSDYYAAVTFDPGDNTTKRGFIVKKDLSSLKCTSLTALGNLKVSYAKAFYNLREKDEESVNLVNSQPIAKIDISLQDPDWKIEFWGENLKDPTQPLLTKLIDYENGFIEQTSTSSS